MCFQIIKIAIGVNKQLRKNICVRNNYKFCGVTQIKQHIMWKKCVEEKKCEP